MSGDHVEIGVNQHRDIKTRRFDAFRNLLDLFLAVLARVCWVRFSSARPRKIISKLRWLVSNPLDFSSLFSCIKISYNWASRLDGETLYPLYMRYYN
jgi:hypothetical protein